MNTIAPAIPHTAYITYRVSAIDYLATLPMCIRRHLMEVIEAKAQYPQDQMIVNSWTFELPDHIFRCMKTFVYRPGLRVIFHCTSDGISIDKIAWRCDDPYGDGH